MLFLCGCVFAATYPLQSHLVHAWSETSTDLVFWIREFRLIWVSLLMLGLSSEFRTSLQMMLRPPSLSKTTWAGIFLATLLVARADLPVRQPLVGSHMPFFGAIAAAAFFPLALQEELFFRGVLQRIGARWLGNGSALFITSALFSFIHFNKLAGIAATIGNDPLTYAILPAD